MSATGHIVENYNRRTVEQKCGENNVGFVDVGILAHSRSIRLLVLLQGKNVSAFNLGRPRPNLEIIQTTDRLHSIMVHLTHKKRRGCWLQVQM